ncbi:hypothetical protein GGF50DRAFT_66663, partial [Schizophyllum commune]
LRRQDMWSRPVMACVAALFVSSTVEVVGLVMYDLLLWPSSDYATADCSISLLKLNIFLVYALQYVISDTTVVWRVWILWQDSRIVKCVSIFCMMGSFAGVIGECALYFNAPKRGQRASAVMMEIPLLITNVVTTILMAIKYWFYVREVKRFVGGWRQSTQIERVLILIIESGIIYCALLAVRFGLDVGVDGAPTTYVACSVVSAAYHSISGILPTLIVFVVAMERWAASTLAMSAQVSHRMRFTAKSQSQSCSKDSIRMSEILSLYTQHTCVRIHTILPAELATLVAACLRHSINMYPRDLHAPTTMRSSAARNVQLVPLSGGDVEDLKLIVMQEGVEVLFYGGPALLARSATRMTPSPIGIQAALLIAALVTLTRQKTWSRPVTACIIALFLSSTCTISVAIVLDVVQMPSLGLNMDPSLPRLLRKLNIVFIVTTRFNYVMSDTIVVWRVWILYRGSRFVKGILLLCLLGSFGASEPAVDQKETLTELSRCPD